MTSLLLLLACQGPTTDPKDGADPDDTDAVWGPVSVVAIDPADGASDVPLGTSLVVTLDGRIDPATLTRDTVYLSPPTTAVLTWDDARRSVTVDPAGDLAHATTYTVHLTTGLGLREAFSSTFTTARIGPAEQDVVSFGADQVTVGIDPLGDGLRSYTLRTTHALRDNVPADRTRRFDERGDAMRLRSGNLLFDALFAMAMDDARLCSVDAIRNYAFANGDPTPCRCFETGELWTYVWTRDTAYATHLALAFVDPERARNSLQFKLSPRKEGGGTQIVQDTGSGGSWPVSTDRVAWALGAYEVLAFLPDDQRPAFRDQVLDALRNTLAEDRAFVWDPVTGLYRGEQSFLDWREQTYPAWTAAEVTTLAMSRSLGTNAAHHAALRIAAALGDEVGDPMASTWAAQADALAEAMARHLWDGDRWSSYVLGDFHAGAQPRSELLGLSLTTLEGIGDHHADALRAWPHSSFGPSVIFPLQARTRIYHNRSIWPFVTAYGALAAGQVGELGVVEAAVDSLVRGAALNLSNMENLDLLTGRNWADAGAESGPVVNSRRQLWSVAGYLSMVVRNVFGMHASQTGLTFAPTLTPALRDRWLGADEIVLHRFPWRGRAVDLVLQLPPGATAYGPATVSHNGVPVAGELTDLVDGDVITIAVSAAASASTEVTRVADGADFRAWWPPVEPGQPSVTATAGGLRVAWAASPDTGVTYDVWRDGERVVEGLDDTGWTDGDVDPASTPCYAITARFDGYSLDSQPSQAGCWWGEGVWEVDARRLRQAAGDGTWSEQHGRAHYMDWGDPGDVLTVDGYVARATGVHAIQVVYGNGAGGVDTGITAGNKLITVVDEATGDAQIAGRAVMPHLGRWDRWEASTPVYADLLAGRTYRIEIRDGLNMSYFEHFRTYTAGLGGGATPFHRVNIAGVRVLPWEALGPSPAPPSVAFDGTADLDAHPDGAEVDPGQPLAAWSTAAVSWDDDNVYLTMVSPAFEADYAPWMVYLEAADDLSPPTPGTGMDYALGAVSAPASLPFTPTHLISARAVSGVGPDGGPWNGVWRRDGAAWRLTHRFAWGVDAWLAADRHTLAVTVPRALLGSPSRLRLAAHVLWGVGGAEWKETLPAGHAPWDDGGSAWEIDLSDVPGSQVEVQ